MEKKMMENMSPEMMKNMDMKKCVRMAVEETAKNHMTPEKKAEMQSQKDSMKRGG